MRLKSLIARKVYGFLDFDLEFDDRLTLITGLNGCGKSTAIRIVDAILTPAFRDLLHLRIGAAVLRFEEGGRDRSISIDQGKSGVRIQISGIDGDLTIPNVAQEELEILFLDDRRNEDFNREIRMRMSDNACLRYLLEVNVPVILGLERRQISSLDEAERFIGDRTISRRQGHRALKYLRGDLGSSLSDIEYLVQEAYSRLRAVDDRHAEELRRNVVLSAFRYAEFNIEDFDSQIAASVMGQRRVLERKDEIRLALKNIGIKGGEVDSQVENFFARLQSLLVPTTDSGARQATGFEFLMNKAQVERISDLITLIDGHRTRAEKVLSPITKFVEAVNFFFADTKKSITVDTVGRIRVVRPKGSDASIDSLSSGERQLLIIFGHIFLNRFGDRSSIFIIDEPEISLHLYWQERLVEQLLVANASAQFVLATHSPEIIGENVNSCVYLQSEA
jgi:predicted ATPase